jgi:hypothetical protein
MGQDVSFWEELDQRLEGDEVRFENLRVTPVARLRGKSFQAGGEHARGAGAGFTLQPEEVIVRERNGERTIAIDPPDREPLRALFLAGGAVAGGCLLVMFLAGRIIRRVL